jgi:predicted nucleic acid-binding protein
VGKQSQQIHKMRVVVDTNVVFSALISSSATIADIIIAPYSRFRFYTCDYLFEELDNHKEKLQKASKLSEKEIDRAKINLFKYINVISLGIIPQNIWLAAEALTIDIDPDDIPFVALSIFLDAHLWTRDKILYNGLKSKGFNNLISTYELANM